MSLVTLKIQAKSFNMQIINNPCPWGKKPKSKQHYVGAEKTDSFIVK